MNWNDYFNMLIDWKKLPAYRAEPRIDSLVGFLLKPILENYLDVNIIGIIPELPIRLGTVSPKLDEKKYADRSYKVDFFAIGSNGFNYLIELKTDSKSRRDKQDDYLIASKYVGTEKIINGILKIASVSRYKKKYSHLKDKLKEYGLLNERYAYSGINQSLEIVYVQPSNNKKEENVIDFDWIANWLESAHDPSSFESEFAKALRAWSKD